MEYALAVAARVCMFTLPHDSGLGSTDKFGDFEAHRTWLITTHTQPLTAWYTHDLQYWGLDYPPLFAYLSWALGCCARVLAPQLLAGGRGYCSRSDTLAACLPDKLFMRASVLLLDMATLFPAAHVLRQGLRGAPQLPLLLLLHPAQLAIDHGHFQYNGGALGLALLAAGLALRRPLLSAALFTLALNLKHTAIYYAPVFLVLLLARALAGSSSTAQRLTRLACLGATVLGTMAALWLPFCVAQLPAGGLQQCAAGLAAVATRLAPLDRGLFEDTVANLWYATESLTRLQRAHFPPSHTGAPLGPAYRIMALACTALAVLLALPSLLLLWRSAARAPTQPASRPLLQHALLALHNCALAFFLVSFHVHEKAILFPALPLALLAPALPAMAAQFALLSVWSMGTLLARDGLLGAAAALCALHLACVRQAEGAWGSRRGAGAQGPAAPQPALLQAVKRCTPSLRLLRLLGALALLALAACAGVLQPPLRYPDLFSKLTAVVCAGAFAAHLVWGTLVQWEWVREEEGGGEVGPVGAPAWHSLVTPKARARGASLARAR